MTPLVNLLYLIIHVVPLRIVIFTFFIILFYYTLKELYILYKTITNQDVVHHIILNNLNNNLKFYIPSNYKIMNIYKNISLIIIYLLFGIIGIFVLRVSRLFKEINLTKILTIDEQMPIILNILYIVCLLMFILNILLLWRIIITIFYREFKKLHIYLGQFGGYLDKDSEYSKKTTTISSSYYYTYYNKIHIFSLYKIKDILTIILDPHMILLNNLPYRLQLFSKFLWISKYAKHSIIKGFIYILKQINAGWITLVKTIPYILLVIIITHDLIVYKGTIKHLYIGLLLFFIYRTWHNLAYFFYESKYHPIDDALCVYYYKLTDLTNEHIYNEHKLYWKTLKSIYCEYAIEDKITQLSLYLYCDLNMEQVKILYFKANPYQDSSDLGKWFVKQRDKFFNLAWILWLQQQISIKVNNIISNKNDKENQVKRDK